MHNSTKKKIISMRMMGYSCIFIAKECRLSKTCVASRLDEWGYSARQVLELNGLDTSNIKSDQISGFMTKMLNQKNGSLTLRHTKKILEYKTCPKHCAHCNAKFFQKLGQSAKDFKNKKFCSISCGNRARILKTHTISSICVGCLKIFSFERKNNFTVERNFCSNGCRARHKNPAPNNQQKRGRPCRDQHQPGPFGKTKPQFKVDVEVTKGNLFSRRSNWQSARNAIQRHAQQTFHASSKSKACNVCGYKKHIEVCHIKSVADFGEGATLGEINAIDNLVGLCPNHHDEFDANLLKIEDILKGVKL